MKLSSIRKALENRLEAAAGAAGVPVAWENNQFTPPQNGAYIESDLLPAENQDIAVQGATLKRGVYQATVVWPLNAGVQGGQALAETIAEAFPNNAPLAADGGIVYVNGEPSIFNGIVDSTGFRIPVSIAYTATS